MATFKQIPKNTWCNWIHRGKMHRGIYLRRFFNKEMNDWTYVFQKGSIGIYYTHLAKNVTRVWVDNAQ